MGIKSRNDIWSLVAVTVALLTFLYCLSSFADLVFTDPAADLLASLRTMSKGDL
ncbi:hypothetical protein [Planococcus sp. CAU13]|uniref:hypothetical protein n=1 Tax=Planococcus sp. CAU13 TaxID=1541197 RepID=UPI000A8800FA|nr:hypothetical protein [Planococcus sp. CAU13]